MVTKKVLVTGGLGFIGAAVSEHFLVRGDRVTIVDSRISNVIESHHFETRRKSLRVIERSISEYLTDGGDLSEYDIVVHAASLVGPASLLSYQGRIGAEIVGTTEKVLEACVATERPLVYISSAEVYGKSGILSEADDKRVPPSYNARIEYALAKLTCEAMVLNSRTRGLRSIVVRPFNVVGPLQSRAGGFVVPTFVQQALGDMPITVFASGEQKRAFLDSRDLARFIGDYTLTALLGEPRVYNVGNPRNATTIFDLAQRILMLLNSSSPIEYTDGTVVYGPHYKEAESYEKLPDITAASSLGWVPNYSLDEIILNTAQHYRQAYDARGVDARLERKTDQTSLPGFEPQLIA